MGWFAIWADGEKYGPASEEEIRLWLEEHRVTTDMILESEDGLETCTVRELLFPESTEPMVAVLDEESNDLAWPSQTAAEPLIEVVEPEPVVLSAPPVQEVFITEQEYVQIHPPKKAVEFPPLPAAKQAFAGALFLSIVSLLLFMCPLIPVAALIASIRAVKLGHAQAKVAVVLSLLAMAASIFFWAVVASSPSS